jgi:hypothetical protein
MTARAARICPVASAAVGADGAAAVEVVGELVPAGVLAGGFGLPDSGGTEAETDVAFTTDGVSEFQEQPVFLGDLGACRGISMVGRSP